MIGTEGGLLPAPIAVSPLTIGSGERADVVIDFEPYAPGTEVLLVNDAPAPFPGPPGAGVVPDVMKFVVSNLPGSPPHTAPLPVSLRPIETLQEIDATVSREFHLRKEPGTCTTEEWTIQSIDAIGNVVGSKWDDITEQPELGETEVWRFVNRSGMMHPMHMHLVLFQILDRQACNETGSQCVPTGPVLAPLPEEQGWKDTIQVGPVEIVRVIARFEDYEGLFAYHCHILEHEDHEMMRQFQSVATVPHCGDGLDNDGDGFTDFAGGDPGCVDALDAGERGPTLPCDDGLDNDGDALADYPADPGCASPGWTTEVPEPSFGPALLISAAWLASMANGRAGSAAGSGSRRGRSRRRARPPGRDAVGPRTLRSL